MQGRIVAAGVSVAVGGALVGFMAAGDHTADASQGTTSAPTSSATSGSTDDGAAANPYDRAFGDDNSGFPSDGAPSNNGFSQPQPQTRTGGS